MTYRGFVEVSTRDRISGWAVDEAGEGCELSLLVNGAVVTSFKSDEARADLVRSGLGGGTGGFSLNPADHLKTGENVVDIRFADGSNVSGTPFICHIPSASNGEHKGYVDIQRETLAGGWAVTPDGRPCSVSVRVNGILKLEVASDQPRPDLAKQGISDGAGGFDVELGPHLTRGPNVVEFIFSDGASLQGSPLEIRSGDRLPEDDTGLLAVVNSQEDVTKTAEAVSARQVAQPMPKPGSIGAVRKRASTSSPGDSAPEQPLKVPAARAAKKAKMPSLVELDELSLDDISLAVAAGLIKAPPPPALVPVPDDVTPEAGEAPQSIHTQTKSPATWRARISRMFGPK